MTGDRETEQAQTRTVPQPRRSLVRPSIRSADATVSPLIRATHSQADARNTMHIKAEKDAFYFHVTDVND